MSLTIAIGSDHAGFEYKETLKNYLQEKGYEVKDYGTHSADSTDYPDFAHPVASSVETGNSSFGVLVCGSGNGVAMTANKHPNVRAALCWTSELSSLARQHNNANVLCVPSRFISTEIAKDMVDSFIENSFEGGRHERRVSKINA